MRLPWLPVRCGPVWQRSAGRLGECDLESGEDVGAEQHETRVGDAARGGAHGGDSDPRRVRHRPPEDPCGHGREGEPEPGELRLEGGLVAFTSENSGLVFRAPLEDVRDSFPKVIFPITYFGVGVKLAVHGTTYRLSFLPVQYLGSKPIPNYSGGTSFGPTWSFSGKDFKPPKAALRQWRAALHKPPNNRHLP